MGSLTRSCEKVIPSYLHIMLFSFLYLVSSEILSCSAQPVPYVVEKLPTITIHIYLPKTEGVLLQSENTDVRNLPQCKQDGIEDCWMFKLDLESLESLKVGDSIKFTDKDSFNIKLQQEPSTSSGGSGAKSTNYQFHTDDGLEDSLTVRQLEEGLSIYGAARTNERIYTIEYAGAGSNVVYWRRADYFNNMQD